MVITKRYNVFNVDQCQDITPLTVEEQNNLVDIAIEEVVNNYIQRESIKITTNPDGNYYSPRIDSINMVELKHFKSSQQYYHTFFHECIHSTGTESRLNRKELQQ
jgi:antirestriction protein ArdC